MPGAGSSGDAQAAYRVAVLSAIDQVLDDPAHLLVVLAEAEDDDDARRRLREAYGFGADQAQAVLDLQFRTVTRGRRSRLSEELARSREVLEGTVHRVDGADPADVIDRLVALVGVELAAPRRRRVAVRLGFPGWPALALVDPIGGAEFRYDDDPRPRGGAGPA